MKDVDVETVADVTMAAIVVVDFSEETVAYGSY